MFKKIGRKNGAAKKYFGKHVTFGVNGLPDAETNEENKQIPEEPLQQQFGPNPEAGSNGGFNGVRWQHQFMRRKKWMQKEQEMLKAQENNRPKNIFEPKFELFLYGKSRKLPTTTIIHIVTLFTRTNHGKHILSIY